MATQPKILADHPKVKAIQSSTQKAHLAFSNKTFIISHGQVKHWADCLPKQCDLLAIRFCDASGGFQASIGGALGAMGRADLLSLAPTSIPGTSVSHAGCPKAEVLAAAVNQMMTRLKKVESASGFDDFEALQTDFHTFATGINAGLETLTNGFKAEKAKTADLEKAVAAQSEANAVLERTVASQAKTIASLESHKVGTIQTLKAQRCKIDSAMSRLSKLENAGGGNEPPPRPRKGRKPTPRPTPAKQQKKGGDKGGDKGSGRGGSGQARAVMFDFNMD